MSNARTDTLAGGGSVNEAIERGRAYLGAGADCIFVLGATRENTDDIGRGIPGPVWVIGGATSPTIAEFAEMGVARVSFGPGPMGVAYAALARLVNDLSTGKPHSPDLAFRP